MQSSIYLRNGFIHTYEMTMSPSRQHLPHRLPLAIPKSVYPQCYSMELFPDWMDTHQQMIHHLRMTSTSWDPKAAFQDMGLQIW